MTMVGWLHFLTLEKWPSVEGTLCFLSVHTTPATQGVICPSLGSVCKLQDCNLLASARKLFFCLVGEAVWRFMQASWREEPVTAHWQVELSPGALVV